MCEAEERLAAVESELEDRSADLDLANETIAALEAELADREVSRDCAVHITDELVDSWTCVQCDKHLSALDRVSRQEGVR